jgi:hypothetical protein
MSREQNLVSITMLRTTGAINLKPVEELGEQEYQAGLIRTQISFPSDHTMP